MPPKINQELVDAREALATIQSELKTASEQYDAGSQSWSGVTVWGDGSDDEKRQTMKEKYEKSNELGETIDRIIGDQQMFELVKSNNARLEANPNPGQAATEQRLAGAGQSLTLGKNFINALKQANLLQNENGRLVVPSRHEAVLLPGALNALFRTAAGAEPAVPREPGVFIPTAEDELVIRDLMPIRPASVYGTEFLRESVFGGTATVVDEPTNANQPEVAGGTAITDLSSAQATARTAAAGYAPELQIELVKVKSEVSDIAAFLPVTERQLRDPAEIESYIETRGDRKMAEAVDVHLINGNETDNLGFMRYGTGSNHDQLQTYGKTVVANVPDNLAAMLRGIRMLREKGGVVTAMLVSPGVWEQTLLTAIQDGRYPLGAPTEMPGNRFWGIRAVISSRMPVATSALLGDFAGECAIRMMDDIFSETSNSHADYFQRFQLAIRFRATLGLQVWTPQRFLVITALDGD